MEAGPLGAIKGERRPPAAAGADIMALLRRGRGFACLVGMVLVLSLAPLWALEVELGPIPAVEVYFSPRAGATEAVVKQIDGARREVLVQAYSFTSAPIARALLEARRRGIRVEVILDKGQKGDRYSSYTFLMNSGIPTYLDDKHAIAHNKVIIVDRQAVVTGSFNFTRAAEEKNAENLLIIRSEALARVYLENWNLHRSHSR